MAVIVSARLRPRRRPLAGESAEGAFKSTNNSHSAVVVRDSKSAADLRKGLSREARSVEGTGGAVMEGSAVGAGADPVDQDVTAT